jgi:hypothetical protein
VNGGGKQLRAAVLLVKDLVEDNGNLHAETLFPLGPASYKPGEPKTDKVGVLDARRFRVGFRRRRERMQRDPDAASDSVAGGESGECDGDVAVWEGFSLRERGISHTPLPTNADISQFPL